MVSRTRQLSPLGVLTHPAFGLLLLMFLQGWFLHYWPSFHPANESIRFYFAEAVVDHGTLSVDPVLERFHTANIDAAKREGRHYMDKAPGLAFAAVPLYGALKAVGLVDSLHWATLWALMTFLLVTLPSIGATALLYRLARDLSGRQDAALLVAAAWAVATPALVYSSLFFGHQFSAVLLLTAFGLLKPTELTPVSATRSALAGLLAGLAVVAEYPAIVAAAGIAVFGLVRAGTMRRRIWLVAGGLVPAVGLVAYHWAAFGGPLALPYQFKANATFAAVHSTGLFGFDVPTPARAMALTVGARRGLLYAAPFLVLYPIGVVKMFGALSWKKARWAVLWVGLAHTALIFGYIYWTGGDCVGPRFLVPALPFLVLPLAALWRPGRAERVARVLRGGLLPGLVLVGFIHHALPHATFPYYPESLTHPLFDLSLPMAFQGCGAPTMFGLRNSTGLFIYVGGALLAIAWMIAATHRRERRPRILGYSLVALVAAVGVLGAQVITAPPPTDRKLIDIRSDIKLLVGCGFIAKKSRTDDLPYE